MQVLWPAISALPGLLFIHRIGSPYRILRDDQKFAMM